MFSSTCIKTLPPVEDVPDDGSYDEPFPLLKLHAPVVTGASSLKLLLEFALKVFRDVPLVADDMPRPCAGPQASPSSSL
jgi:hypothetical protein